MSGNPNANSRKRRMMRLLLDGQDGRCYLCGRVCRLQEATIDHIRPRSRGGSDDPSNFAVAHDYCNCVKGDQIIDDPLIAEILRMALLVDGISVRDRRKAVILTVLSLYPKGLSTTRIAEVSGMRYDIVVEMLSQMRDIDVKATATHLPKRRWKWVAFEKPEDEE